VQLYHLYLLALINGADSYFITSTDLKQTYLHSTPNTAFIAYSNWTYQTTV